MKPHVICHMLGPLDGRLLVDSWAPEGSAARQAVLEAYQRLHVGFEADAWIVGTTTMKDFAADKASKAPSGAPKPERPWHVADPRARRFAVTVDRHATLSFDKPMADEGHIVVVLGAAVDDDHLAALAAAGVSYFVTPSGEIDLGAVLEQLDERLGIRKILLEGGGRFNGAFLKAGLVDEISLVVWPAIDGRSGSPAIFETGDTSVGQSLALDLAEVTKLEGGGVHLRYDVRPLSRD